MTVAAPSLNRLAFQATTHCLTGCAIGEVVGMVIATALGWGAFAAIVGIVAFPVNRWMIGRGQGHAVVHGAHDHAGHSRITLPR